MSPSIASTSVRVAIKILVDGGRDFYVADTRTHDVRKIWSVTRDVIGPPRLTRDGRAIYFSRRVSESDVWLMTMR